MDPKLKEAGWEKYAEFKVTCRCWVHDNFTTSNNTDTVFQKIVFFNSEFDKLETQVLILILSTLIFKFKCKTKQT